ncbi:ribosomal protein L31e, putative [Trichomonas vaginalis G3]|uniref:Ribosomal protein L31e, putative n=1 Tax=Trichomonas vaginalis (strain ATCC PRA-98 / G3) TaxID=412133 RepID=A2DN98_TRIV3|nr:structural constituent of ribosome [Trichomonas vaginalis G3]EAY18086.1 ribosomal protein L31e, putative [Trichomonas vaginalis G3]KAI5492363.1 structural constituent of ribosome [Trichomonas vaginalis G3]|eukprot:XP_001579072.1 ribosomal protein L31e [Trichomonas vaginalis G3]
MPKELAPAKIETTIHLQKAVHGTTRRFRAERAIKVIAATAKKMMHTEVVKIDPELNSRIWIHGKNCPPTRVRVTFERKADEEDAEKMITIASFKNVASFNGLQTTKVVDQ